MNSIVMYLLIASATIASPGPGVVLSITNALTYDKKATMYGIIGLSLGMLAIAIISATSIGVLIATSDKAFITLQVIGAFYILYMGSKMLVKKSSTLSIAVEDYVDDRKAYNGWGMFKQGLLTSLSNPKPILFFMAIFPQFIHEEQAYLPQFLLLALTFSLLVIVIHYGYAASFSLANTYFWKSQDKLHVMTKIGGAVLILLSIMLIASVAKTLLNI